MTTPIGLVKYQMRSLPAAASEALVELRNRGWRKGVPSICSCGKDFTRFATVICRHCSDTQCGHRPIRGYIIKIDGRAAPRQICADCGAILRPDPPRGTWLYDVCFWDHRELSAPEPCERCGDTDGSQRHHWAPSAIFADADSWPTSFLCEPCHARWHSAMREAGGYRLDDDLKAVCPNITADNTSPWLLERLGRVA